VKVSTNIKLGHKTAIKGGQGVDGEAVGDDDSFTTPGGFKVNVGERCECKDKSLGWRSCKVTAFDSETAMFEVEFGDGERKGGVQRGLLREPLGQVLIGKSLVHDTGDREIDLKMGSYRREVDKRVLRGQLEEEVGAEDELSVVSGMTMMNRTMFMADDTPRFGDYVGHMTVTENVREQMRNREGVKEEMERRRKRKPRKYDMTKTLDFIQGIEGLDERDLELVREARG
jgi:hypothetical protein